MIFLLWFYSKCCAQNQFFFFFCPLKRTGHALSKFDKNGVILISTRNSILGRWINLTQKVYFYVLHRIEKSSKATVVEIEIF